MLRLSCLDEPVEIVRDRYGIPHVYARSRLDLVRAQGYVHAQDRLFQMEGIRRFAWGRLSELAGPQTLELDRTARRLLLRRAAERELRRVRPRGGRAPGRVLPGRERVPRARPAAVRAAPRARAARALDAGGRARAGRHAGPVALGQLGDRADARTPAGPSARGARRAADRLVPGRPPADRRRGARPRGPLPHPRVAAPRRRAGRLERLRRLGCTDGERPAAARQRPAPPALDPRHLARAAPRLGRRRGVGLHGSRRAGRRPGPEPPGRLGVDDCNGRHAGPVRRAVRRSRAATRPTASGSSPRSCARRSASAVAASRWSRRSP